MKKLDFVMPRFNRLSWVSAEMNTLWSPKIEAIAKALNKYHERIFSKEYSLYFSEKYPHTLSDKRPKNLHVLEYDDQILNCYFIDRACDDRKVSTLKGKNKDIQQALDALEEGDFSGFHHAFGVPSCCAKHLAELKASGGGGALWYAVSKQENNKKVVQGHFTNNLAFSKLGIQLINHFPCSERCEATMDIGLSALASLERIEGQAMAESLREMLSWSYSWSTLRGITEIKTPIFKLIHNDQATAEKYECEWHGTHAPKTNLKGLGFPYEQPSELIFSDSKAFKRGLENVIV